MGLLQKLLSTLGLKESSNGRGSEPPGETTVTVEHEPDTTSESAVKGTDGVSEDTAASGSTSTITDTADTHVGATEPSEAAGDTDDPDDVGETDETDDAVSDTAAEPAEAVASADAGDDTAAGDVDTAEDGDAAETGSDESPDVLNGIGPAYAERLSDAGVESVGDLAAADPGELAEETGLGEGRIANWIEQAKEY